ncbi:MAG: RNA polymerase sigma factor [Microthrixaceae bacterium]
MSISSDLSLTTEPTMDGRDSASVLKVPRSEPADNVHPDLAALMTTGVAPALKSRALSRQDADETFEQLILPESEIMFRVALSLTRNRADAEDLVQESLLRAYKAIHTFDGSYPRAWVLTIVRNTERNRHRRRRPELLADPEIAEESGPATSSDEVELRAEHKELGGAIAQAVSILPANFQQVVQLVDIDGLTYQEAAELIEVPLGTVMSRLHRARRRLRELLLPQGFGPGESEITHAVSQLPAALIEVPALLGDMNDLGELGDLSDLGTLGDPLTELSAPSLVAGQPYVAGSALTEQLRKASKTIG